MDGTVPDRLSDAVTVLQEAGTDEYWKDIDAPGSFSYYQFLQEGYGTDGDGRLRDSEVIDGNRLPDETESLLLVADYSPEDDSIRLYGPPIKFIAADRTASRNPDILEAYEEFLDGDMYDLPSADGQRRLLSQFFPTAYGGPESWDEFSATVYDPNQGEQDVMAQISEVREGPYGVLNEAMMRMDLAHRRAGIGHTRAIEEEYTHAAQVALEQAFLRRHQHEQRIPPTVGDAVIYAWQLARYSADDTSLDTSWYRDLLRTFDYGGPGSADEHGARLLDQLGDPTDEPWGRDERRFLLDYQAGFRGEGSPDVKRAGIYATFYAGHPYLSFLNGSDGLFPGVPALDEYSSDPPHTPPVEEPDEDSSTDADSVSVTEGQSDESEISFDHTDLGPMADPDTLYQQALSAVNGVMDRHAISAPPELLYTLFLDEEHLQGFRDGRITFGEYDPGNGTISVYAPPLKLDSYGDAMAADRSVASALTDARDDMLRIESAEDAKAMRHHLFADVYGVSATQEDTARYLEQIESMSGEGLDLNQMAILMDLARLELPDDIRSRIDRRYQTETQLTMEHELLHVYQVSQRIPMDVGEAASHAWTVARRGNLGTREGNRKLMEHVSSPVYEEYAPDAPAHAQNIIDDVARDGSGTETVMTYQERFAGDGRRRKRPGIGVPGTEDLIPGIDDIRDPGGIDSLGGRSTGSPIADFLIDAILD